ncbi:MAG: hypothetical protein M1830_009506 [Pleopsidium flavum]|nr:MAG: hypothetical protein M1830_009506 [Pleopsidium flavum]
MFGAILPSRPVLTNLSTITPTQFALTFPSSPPFSHIVVFLLPGNLLPPDTAAAVYIQFPGSPEFKFLGAIGNEKQSAIFIVHGGISGLANGAAAARAGDGVGEDADVMLDDDAPPANGVIPGAMMMGDVNLGISIEPIASIQAQLASLQASQPTSASTALVKRPPSTKVLAQRIIKNAFNFLASFAGGQGGKEVVPLRSFQDWWVKFERRIENDPGFLERDEDG